MTETYNPDSVAEIGHNSGATEGRGGEPLRPLARLANLVDRARRDEALLEFMLANVETLNERLNVIRRELIPDVMREMQLTKVKMNDGAVVELGTQVHASIIGDDEPFKWLDANGFGGLIKTDVIVQYNGDKRATANDLVVRLKNEKIVDEDASIVSKASVHASTLKSWVRERFKNNETVPVEYFNTSSFVEAKIKEKK